LRRNPKGNQPHSAKGEAHRVSPRAPLARSTLFLVAVSLSWLGCPLPAAAPVPLRAEPALPWVSTFDRDHPLVGKIWETKTGAWVDSSALLTRAARAEFVLLGEQHDNPDHHRLQASILASMVRAGDKPAVLLEMLDTDQDALVEKYRATPGATALGLGAALDWEKGGWPAWPLYLPIAEVAFDAGLLLASANLPHATVRAIVHDGLAGVPPERVSHLGLDRPLAAPLEASLEEEMRSSHCGQLPEAMVAPMALAQRARDGQMVARLLAASRPSAPVVLIAGSGHVRTDRGVAKRLSEAKPDAPVLSVAFVEVDAALTTAEGYAPRFHADRLPFDFAWFTPRAKDDDPCAGFHVHSAPHPE
jgi:uncharacterized iron-regulated protein